MPTVTVVPTAAGLDATVAATGGGAVTVYASPFGGRTGPAGWAAAGSRAGDGVVALALAPGHYWVSALAAGAWAAPVYGVVTDPADAVRTRCVSAVAALLGLLAFDGIDPGRVYVRHKRQATMTEQLPCVEVRRGEGADDEAYMGAEYDRPGYPVLVLFKLREVLGPDALAARSDLWHQQIARTFRNQELAAVPECWQVRVKPLPDLDPSKTEYQLVTGGALLLCDVYEPRGFGL